MSDLWKEVPRLVITAVILALFTYAVMTHWGTGLEETLKNIVLLAVGFWLGSSRGAQSQTENVGKALDVATANSPSIDPMVTLRPGETAQAEEEK